MFPEVTAYKSRVQIIIHEQAFVKQVTVKKKNTAAPQW